MFSWEVGEIDHSVFSFVGWSAWFYFISVFICIYLLQVGQSFKCENINQIWLLWRHLQWLNKQMKVFSEIKQ